jgi:tetratricopeptide (TPR) repeat protein
LSKRDETGFLIALVAACCLMAAMRLSAQAAPAQAIRSRAKQSKTCFERPANQPHQRRSRMPILSRGYKQHSSDALEGTPALPEGTYGGEANAADSMASGAEGDDVDPVRSPDDAERRLQAPCRNWNRAPAGQGLDKLLPGTDDDDQPQGKKRKLAGKEPEHQETSAEDIEVGQYELDRKNWKAALSRFESAMVLAPDEPEVYWGLAESERNLGHFAEARTYYLKLLDYDPDGPHAKAARKALKDPEVANAKAATTPQETIK